MNIDFSSFQGVFQWLIGHGYPLMFLAMCIEGPTVTAAATFATTMGFFNPWIVFTLSILGDVIPDLLYYTIGRWGRLSFVIKIGRRFGLTDAKIEQMELLIKARGGTAVAVLKYTPILATPGLMLVGALRMGWWKYVGYVLLVTLQKTLTFMALGYFFGRAYNISKYIKIGALLPFVIVILYLAFAYFYKTYSEKIVNKIEKI